MNRPQPGSADEALPSNLRFGLFFACVFAGVALYGVVRHWASAWIGLSAAVGALMAVAALTRPQWLLPLNRAWARLGQLLGRIVSPIVLGAIFFILLTPLAWALRRAGRDELGLKRRDVRSYWIDRDPPGPDPQTYRNQY